MTESDAFFKRFVAVTDASDWESVYAETLPKVFNYVLYRVGDMALAEDLTATTFERAWKQRKRYRHDRAGLLAWLLGIARHLIADSHRRQRPTEPLDEATAASADASPDVLSEARDTAERLQRLLHTLPAREQELIALKYGADLTNRQIARLTGLSESNVGTILHRTIQQLRQTWDRK
jgi:RNA polymerase sigma-70 factor (ECF subfamily)